MAISQLSHTVCVNCSKNTYAVSDISSGTVSAPVTAETLTITYPNDDSVTLDLFANNDTLFANSLNSSALGCTSVSIVFDVANSSDYNLYVVYTDANGDIDVQSITVPSDGNATAEEIGGAIVSALSANGVTASYSSGVVTFSGSGFSIAAVNNSTTNILISSVTAETLIDGKYILTWSLTDDDSTYTSTIESYFLCNVECCVRGKMSAIDVSCDCVGDKKNEAAIEAMLMLQGIKAAAACGKDAKADKLLEGLQAICNNECKSC